MKTDNSLTAVSQKCQTGLHSMEPVIESIVLEITGKIVRHMESHRGESVTVLQEAADLARRDMLDRLTAPEFYQTLNPDRIDDQSEREQDRMRSISFMLRKISSELVIPFHRADQKTHFSGYVWGSILGTFFGVLAAMYFNISPENRLILALGLAPVMSLCGVLLMRWLSLKTSVINWISNIRSKDMLDMSQLKPVIRDSVHAWLKVHLVMAFVISHFIPSNSVAETDMTGKIPDELLSAIRKLALAPVEKRGHVADEVIQEYLNAGFSHDTQVREVKWTDDLYESYNVLGIVRPGDSCRVLTCPVYHDGKILQKGRLTRQRS